MAEKCVILMLSLRSSMPMVVPVGDRRAKTRKEVDVAVCSEQTARRSEILQPLWQELKTMTVDFLQVMVNQSGILKLSWPIWIRVVLPRAERGAEKELARVPTEYC